MSGPIPKPAARRQRRNLRGPLQLVAPDVARTTPEPPAGLLAASVAAWRRLWASPVASAFLDSDLPALERLWQLYDERRRAFRVARTSRLVEGSQGQPRLNPLIAHVAALDGQILALEDRFGLTPRARLQLGITFGEAHRSLADLNASFLEEAGS